MNLPSGNGGSILYTKSGSLEIYSTMFHNSSTSFSNEGGAIYFTGNNYNLSNICFSACSASIAGAYYSSGNANITFSTLIGCYSKSQDTTRTHNGYIIANNMNSTSNIAGGDGGGLEFSLVKNPIITLLTIALNKATGIFTTWYVTTAPAAVSHINIINNIPSSSLLYIANSWSYNNTVFYGNSGKVTYVYSGSVKFYHCLFSAVPETSSVSTYMCSIINTCDTIHISHLNTAFCEVNDYMPTAAHRGFKNIAMFVMLLLNK